MFREDTPPSAGLAFPARLGPTPALCPLGLWEAGSSRSRSPAFPARACFFRKTQNEGSLFRVPFQISPSRALKTIPGLARPPASVAPGLASGKLGVFLSLAVRSCWASNARGEGKVRRGRRGKERAEGAARWEAGTPFGLSEEPKVQRCTQGRNLRAFPLPPRAWRRPRKAPAPGTSPAAAAGLAGAHRTAAPPAVRSADPWQQRGRNRGPGRLAAWCAPCWVSGPGAGP